jgi:hypothetical protein
VNEAGLEAADKVVSTEDRTLGVDVICMRAPRASPPKPRGGNPDTNTTPSHCPLAVFDYCRRLSQALSYHSFFQHCHPHYHPATEALLQGHLIRQRVHSSRAFAVTFTLRTT